MVEKSDLGEPTALQLFPFSWDNHYLEPATVHPHRKPFIGSALTYQTNR